METGCYIDGSHMSSFDFSAAVVHFAHDNGMEMDYDRFVADMIEFENMDGEDQWEILNALDWEYSRALDYLNDSAPDGLYWEVEDNSLFLVESEEG
jgi:hypothetical protein